MSPVHPTAATGFANSADDYERARPSYAAAAVTFLGEALDLRPGRTVVDVAAGTGKLTRLLVPSGAEVIAVEPVDEMRAILRAQCPTVDVRAGTAEDLPVSEADAITVAQAFHWLDGPAALASFHRVLRPGGRLAVVYNERTSQPGWVADVYALIRGLRSEVPQREDGDWKAALWQSELFGPAERREFANPHTLSRELALARFRSLSYVGALPEDRQRAVLEEIAEILDTHPDTRGLSSVVIPQHTAVWVSTRR